MDSRLALGLRSPPPEEFPSPFGEDGEFKDVSATDGDAQATFLTDVSSSVDYSARLPSKEEEVTAGWLQWALEQGGRAPPGATVLSIVTQELKPASSSSASAYIKVSVTYSPDKKRAAAALAASKIGKKINMPPTNVLVKITTQAGDAVLPETTLPAEVAFYSDPALAGKSLPAANAYYAASMPLVVETGDRLRSVLVMDDLSGPTTTEAEWPRASVDAKNGDESFNEDWLVELGRSVAVLHARHAGQSKPSTWYGGATDADERVARKATVAAFTEAIWNGQDVQDYVADDATFTFLGIVSDAQQTLGMCLGYKVAFPAWTSKIFGFKKNDDGSGTYSVETQQVAGLLKASVPAIGTFPSVHYRDTPVMARLKPLIFPTEVRQYTFADDGRIQKVEYMGEIAAERGATSMHISPSVGAECLYQWLGLVEDEEGKWAPPAPQEADKSAAAAVDGEDGEDGAGGDDAAAETAAAAEEEEEAPPPVPAAPEPPVFRRKKSKAELGIVPDAPGPQQPPRAYTDMFKLGDEMVVRNKALEGNGVGLMQTLLDRRNKTGSMAMIEVDPTVDAGLRDEITERIQSLYSHHHDDKLVRLIGRIAEHWPSYLNSEEGELQRQRMWAGVGHTVVHGDLHIGNMLFENERRVAKLVDFQNWGRGPAALDIAFCLLSWCKCPVADERIAKVAKTYSASLEVNGIEYHSCDVLADVAWCLIQLVTDWIVESAAEDGGKFKVNVDTADQYSDEWLGEQPFVQQTGAKVDDFKRAFVAYGLPEAEMIRACYLLLELVSNPILAGSTPLGRTMNMAFHSHLYDPPPPPPEPKPEEDEDDE